MGYDVVFVPTEEQMKKYKPWNERQAELNQDDDQVTPVRMEIVSLCMRGGSRENFYTAMELWRQLTFQLRFLKGTIDSEEQTRTYFRWKNNEKHELNFCGHELTRPAGELDMSGISEELFTLAHLVDTPDYFDDRDKFSTKLEKINEVLDDFIWYCQEHAIHEIVDYFREIGVTKAHDDLDDYDSLKK